MRPAEVAVRGARAIDADEVVRDLLRLDPGLRLESYYGEQAIFYNPGRVAPLGVIFAAVKDHDGPHDRAALLSRAGVYRFAFGLTAGAFAKRFGEAPARPPKGGVIELAGYDSTRLDELMPHPVYGWMGWVQILSPTPDAFEPLRPLLEESLAAARAKWERRRQGTTAPHEPRAHGRGSVII